MMGKLKNENWQYVLLQLYYPIQEGVYIMSLDVNI